MNRRAILAAIPASLTLSLIPAALLKAFAADPQGSSVATTPAQVDPVVQAVQSAVPAIPYQTVEMAMTLDSAGTAAVASTLETAGVVSLENLAASAISVHLPSVEQRAAGWSKSDCQTLAGLGLIAAWTANEVAAAAIATIYYFDC